ncbi:hypothetical protein [Bacillus sp. AR18-7]|uniref:hypothetical protein n=1 Tax=Bacillus sp. AR18-7 TaxID=2217821 RepID=UPI0011C7F4CF|nr:hypothetical protein [Bacillus sp. AR18-7]
MDSNGDIIEGPGPASETAIYQAPYKLPIDPHKVRDILKEVKSKLKGIDREKAYEEFGLFIPDIFLNILNVVGKIAGYLGPIASVVSIAIDIAKIFGFLKEGKSPLEIIVCERFKELEDGVQTIAIMIHTQNLQDGRIAIGNFSAFVQNTNITSNNSNLSLTQLENNRTSLLNSHEEHIDWFTKLFDSQTWQSMFDRNEHSQVWGPISDVLYTMPWDIGKDPVLVQMPEQNKLYYEHRLMVPMVSMAALSYLASIRGISPEYRTTGDFRENIKNFANNIYDLAQKMRSHVLARTIYKPEHFAYVCLNPDEVTYDSFDLFEGYKGLKISPNCKRWPVGALDLRYHNNAYFGNFNLSGRGFIAGSAGVPRPFGGTSQIPSKYGLMNAQWVPPAVLEPVIGYTTLYRITNPEECAKAANAQSEIDYAKLLSASGYFELLQLATLFRHEFTSPNKSQTIFCKTPRLLRSPLPSTNVTVESKPILGSGVIKSSAVREQQEFFATASIRTQSINRARPVQYKVTLRTMISKNGDRWLEPEYAQYQRAEYVPDSANEGFLKLELIEDKYSLLSEHPLITKWKSSPREETIRKEGTVELTADTFDWWIPVESKSPFKPKNKFEINEEMMLPKKFLPIDMPSLSWKSGGQDWVGEHREIKKETIKIDYSLEWTEDQLTVNIKSNPENRNFVVFVVVEELLTGTKQVLHTAVAVPINGLLTYVPQKFFDDENEAIAKAYRAIIEYNKRYTKNRVPGPADPIIGWIRPDDLVINLENINRFVQLIEKHEPELYKELMSSFEENQYRIIDERDV